MKLHIPEGVTRAVATTALKAKKNSPHIFFAGGVIGVLGSTFLACRATLKLEENIDEIKVDLDKVRSSKSVVSNQEYSKSLASSYFQAAKKIGILYGPSVIIGGLSIAAITNSHIQLTKRNAALTAAYAGLSTAFEEYRGRVREELGEERERDLYLSAKEVTLDEEGKKIKAKVADGLPNEYARFFDRNNANWKPSPDFNRWFLMSQQNYANDKLRVDGFVFLNDVYDWLGFDRTQIGQLVGWTIHSHEGDGYISFGLDDAFNVRKQNAVESTHLLDFNVEGIVYDKI